MLEGNRDFLVKCFKIRVANALFAVYKVCRYQKERTNKKFIKRFQYLESKSQELGKSLMDMSLAEMDVFWNEAKKL